MFSAEPANIQTFVTRTAAAASGRSKWSWKMKVGGRVRVKVKVKAARARAHAHADLSLRLAGSTFGWRGTLGIYIYIYPFMTIHPWYPFKCSQSKVLIV